MASEAIHEGLWHTALLQVGPPFDLSNSSMHLRPYQRIPNTDPIINFPFIACESKIQERQWLIMLGFV